MKDNWRCFKILKEHGANMHNFNFRGWAPLQLASHKIKYFKQLRKEIKSKELKDMVEKDPV
jgi:hypothetical protein